MELIATLYTGPAQCVFATESHDFAISAGVNDGPAGAEYQFTGGQVVSVIPDAPVPMQSASVHIGMRGLASDGIEVYDYDALVGATLSI